ncbi:transglutaminase family protein [Tamlana sp. 2_MG-2023]|uniref:transglutaminase family protein n=1 Tax=unclassified Tamlana TaxID=2614803 RepID=UPI0026E172C4|nr:MULTISPECIES: transglutaminase family protein [unclassified Tamlana]MDO6759476.1 transglutaminase family protein [Tamlana sp. 2_MG-2023]MDO6790385.1 transglutaminase family protein [Tamlana sp. 1_MG-2023]
MALKIVISHKTKYKYDRKVSLSPHIFRLRPAPHSRTPIESYSIKIKPENQFFNWQQDPFGNYVARLVFPDKTDELSIDVEIIADLKTINPFDFFIEESAEEFPFKYSDTIRKELQPYLEITDEGKLIQDFIKTIDYTPRKTIYFLIDINRKIYEYLSYNIRMEPGVQSCEETLERKNGSCRDFAWLFVQTLRHLGFGARFVSGYLVQLKSDEKSLDGPSGPEEDFTDLHAWAEVYLPGAGWIGFDATSGLLAGEGHIPLACTPSFESAAPVSGATDVCETEFFFENSVTRIFESPRVTKPYTEEQWKAIYKLGNKVEKQLQKGDVRLTMGGEPTFVSIDDLESPEWNTTADGPLKRKLAKDLSKKLHDAFGKGGVLHHAQGKWYPGEPLPRWQIEICWRKDGRPIWYNKNLLATYVDDYFVPQYTDKLFLETLTKYLSVTNEHIKPTYEDPFYYLYEQGNLPTDYNPEDDKDGELAKKKINQIFENGISTPVGYLLPLNKTENKWFTSAWTFRRNHLFLTPGDSPIGLRLPLASLEAKPEHEIFPIYEPELFGIKGRLPSFKNIVKERYNDYCTNGIDQNTPNYFVRTALCAEIREGKLYLFLPPLESAEIFLDLIASIEMTAKELNVPVILEGYEPPKDNRLESLKITPDPAVIEVNVHPVKDWEELCHNTFTIYDLAKQSRLGTEKFMLDGKHTGTGGGNHVTLGGVSPKDSPLLRKPSLLRSLLTFWQHHPGLTYLFSGAFVGPTSQAPRIDEARMENLYELEIAFEQIPKDGEVPYWLTDRLFRHLLTDLTGNTHRAEFCIDKLYSPDSSSGRLGILELRGFDMPPHPQMSLTQMLLVRTLVAWFWKKPYEHNLVRWGTELHDKFLIEHYVREDIKDVVEQLNRAGYAFKEEWFNPFFEFRFPLHGMVEINKIHMELRAGIEPWNVLGEEMTGGGTARYVDSSLERLQVKVSNFIDERFVLTCNGVKVQLKSTGVQGEYVAGVKYKAWDPYSALHPTIPVDTPLVFDIVDTWNRRSIGGCTYFVAHPGGRSYESYPVNSFEAESRRINRFWEFGHTQGEIEPVEEINPDTDNPNRSVEEKGSSKRFKYKELPVNFEFPYTLDLRKK